MLDRVFGIDQSALEIVEARAGVGRFRQQSDEIGDALGPGPENIGQLTGHGYRVRCVWRTARTRLIDRVIELAGCGHARAGDLVDRDDATILRLRQFDIGAAYIPPK